MPSRVSDTGTQSNALLIGQLSHDQMPCFMTEVNLYTQGATYNPKGGVGPHTGLATVDPIGIPTKATLIAPCYHQGGYVDKYECSIFVPFSSQLDQDHHPPTFTPGTMLTIAPGTAIGCVEQGRGFIAWGDDMSRKGSAKWNDVLKAKFSVFYGGTPDQHGRYADHVNVPQPHDD